MVKKSTNQKKRSRKAYRNYSTAFAKENGRGKSQQIHSGGRTET